MEWNLREEKKTFLNDTQKELKPQSDKEPYSHTTYPQTIVDYICRH